MPFPAKPLAVPQIAGQYIQELKFYKQNFNTLHSRIMAFVGFLLVHFVITNNWRERRPSFKYLSAYLVFATGFPPGADMRKSLWLTGNDEVFSVSSSSRERAELRAPGISFIRGLVPYNVRTPSQRNPLAHILTDVLVA